MKILCELRTFSFTNSWLLLEFLTKPQFCVIFLTEPSTWENDADGGGDDVPTIFLAWPSPSPNARRDKMSRKGKPLTLIRQIIDFSSVGCSCPLIFTHFLHFSSLNPVPCGKPWNGSPRRVTNCTHLPGPVSVPQASLPPTVCGAQKAVTYEISIFSIEFP